MSITEQTELVVPAQEHAAPKWAAVVADRMAPMPRRRLRARDILHQAGAPDGAVLVRDLNSPIDVGFAPDAMVDLAEGNVFRLVHGCQADEIGARGAAPKLAFVVDDAWEVTIEPQLFGNCIARYHGPDGWVNVRALADPLLVGTSGVTELRLEDGRRVLVVGDCTVWFDPQ